MCENTGMAESLLSQIADQLAASHASSGPTIAADIPDPVMATLAEFMVRSVTTLEAVVLRLAREVDELRGVPVVPDLEGDTAPIANHGNHEDALQP
jgi:hypothetical protein